MICQHADCSSTATVKTRFGDGTFRSGRLRHRQTFVHYCGPCFQAVGKLFHLHDVTLLAEVA